MSAGVRLVRTGRRRPSTHVCKITMAVTGVILALFVIVHMVGNLKVYFGAESLNHYALWLRHAFEPLLPYEGLLWILRVVLLACVLAHLICGAILWRRARTARGSFRAPLDWRSFTARSMPVTGLVLLAFVVFHILDLTTGTAGAAGFQAGTETSSHAYENLIGSFQRPAASIVYVVAMLALAAHVAHGVWMAAHDLGVTGRRTRAAIKVGAGIAAIALLVGNASIPVAVLLGVLS